MPYLQLKTSYKVLREYFQGLRDLESSGQLNEGAVAPLFANLLRFCSRKAGWTLIEQYPKQQPGNRSALDWIVDQYRIKTDKRSGIVNDPNRDDDPEYIVRLIKQIVTVSLETVKTIRNLPALE
jgi:hypothetical protein